MRSPFIINQRGKIGPDEGPIVGYLKSPGGRQHLAQLMVAPIRRSLDYHSISRQALCIDPLPQGALPYYKEPVVGKFKHDHLVIDNRGKLTAKGRYIFAKRVVVPQFEIFSNPTINIADIKRRRFHVIDRAVQKARQQIMKQEDDAIFELLDAAGKK